MYPPVVVSRLLARLLCGSLLVLTPLFTGCPDEPADDDASATDTPEAPSEPTLVIRPPAIDFGEVLIQTTAKATLEIANEGDADLYLGRVELQSTGGGAYALSEEISGLNLIPGAFITLEVSFSPAADIGYGGAIRVESNDEDASLATVPLSGKGSRGTDDDKDDVTIEEGDCDDADDSVHPGAEEECDGKDNDCDDESDEGFDADEDGYSVCDQPPDCDDEDETVHPDALELCDGKDNDCDDDIDEGFDATGDGTSDCLDDDGDQELDPTDCDDTDAGVHTGAEEQCDGKDNNCDGQIDEGPDDDGDGTSDCIDDDGDGVSEQDGDCDDQDSGIHPGATERCNEVDDDCDTEVDEDTRIDADGDQVSTCDGDCDDTDPLVYPGAAERCNDLDDDCDGAKDEGVPTRLYYRDADQDAFGDAGNSTTDCDAPAGYVPDQTDCDDAQASIHPGASEVCNGADEDCDGQVDEGIPTSSWYADRDGDGYGDPAVTRSACSQPAGYVADKADCDDSSPLVHPGATEQCNGIDDDCDGTADEGVTTRYYPDADNDTYGQTGGIPKDACSRPQGYAANAADCNDANPSINPGAPEQCNGVDDDCNGQIDDNVASTTFYRDADGDGYGNPALTWSGCAAPEGYVPNALDCDDTKSTIHPAATEQCNGIDDNCNGATDEGVKTSYYVDADHDSYGRSGSTPTEACTAPTGYVANALDCDDTKASIYPGATEQCNGIDDDCDGTADDGVPTSTWYRDADNDGYGSSSQTLAACSKPAGYVADKTDCNDSSAQIHPGATEQCNSVDDDCDGQIDEGAGTVWYKDQDGDGYGSSSQTTTACSRPTGFVSDKTDCDDAKASIHPGAAEQCNGLDDDCDTQIDEGLADCDSDQDGWSEEGACDDANPALHPMLVDATYTGVPDGSIDHPFPTIQEGIDAADDACPFVYVMPGTYPERIDFLGRDLVVASIEGPETTLIDGAELLGSLVTFAGGETADAVLDGFTITHGYAVYGAGISIDGASPVIRNNLIVDNETEDGGAGIFINGGAPLITDNLFQSNVGATSAAGSLAGGAILVQYSEAVITHNDFVANEHISGGAIGLLTGADVTISLNVFERNTAMDDVGDDGVGGALFLSGSSPVIDDNLFDRNASSDAGGAIYLNGGSSALSTAPVISANDFLSNTAGDVLVTASTRGLGGAIYGIAVAPTVTKNTFTGNKAASNGGAVYFLKNSIVDLSRNVFTGNAARNSSQGAGGAIYLSNSSAVVEQNTLEANSAAAGGGMTLGDMDALVIHNHLLGNTASSRGGGISLFNQYGASTPVITNNILQRNSAPTGYGGAIYTFNKGSYVTRGELINNVIAESSSSSAGAGLYVGTDAPLVIMNNIFFQITTKEAVYVSTGSTILPTVQYNDFYANTKNSGGKLSTLDSTNLLVDPRFVAWSANGLFDDDFHLEPASALVDAGNPQSVYDDINGSINDIGAYGGADGDW